MKIQFKFKALVIFLSMTLMLPDAFSQSWNTEGNEATPEEFIGTNNEEDLILKTSGEERMRLSKAGNVGIGTDKPTEQLTVGGVIESTLGGVKFPDGTLQSSAGPSLGADFSFDDLDVKGRLKVGLNSIILDASAATGATGTENHIYTTATTSLDNTLYIQSHPLSLHNTVLNEDKGSVGIGVGIPATKFHVDGGIDASFGGGGYMVLGDKAASNIVMDDNEIMARDNGREAILFLQNNGGELRVHHDGTAGTQFIVKKDGKVGIGSSFPEVKLNVIEGTDAELTNTTSGFLMLGKSGGKNIVMDNNEIMARNGSLNSTLFFQQDGGEFRIHNNRPVAEKFVVLGNGNVGLGVETPANKLEVCGLIRAKEVVVETMWCDFVFEDDYHLLPLEEVDQYIKKHGHLPDIPSAAEVDANGVKLGEVHAKLLQKIEELTLYMIDTHEEIKSLKKENAYMKAQLNAK